MGAHTEPTINVFFKAEDKDRLQPAFKAFTAMTCPEKRSAIRERLEGTKKECSERRSPDKTQQKKPSGGNRG